MAAAAHRSMTNYSASPGLAGLREGLGRLLRLWRTRTTERHAFGLIGERDLHDFGATRWDVERELARPFWRG